MPAVTFRYEGRTRQGTVQRGEVAAASREEAIALLRRQQILPTVVKPKAKGFELKLPGIGGRVSDKDLTVFTRQFATMIDAGLPLVQCLEILSQQTENKTLAKVITQIRQDVESGATLTDALKKHPKVFNDLYVNMTSAGEAGGILDTILNRLAAHIEKVMKLKKRVKSAMIYPAVVIGVAVAVLAIIMIFVIPVFAKMYEGFGATLPLPTQIVVSASNFVASWMGGGIVLGSIILLAVGIRLAYKTQKGRMIIDRLLLRLPIVGILIRKVAVAKFTRTLGTLISSGVPILDGLQIVARTAGNRVIEKAVVETRQSVSEGKTLADPLSASKVFPPMVTSMIAVGESTGALDTMLGKIADFYEEEVDVAVANLTSLLEPVMIVFLGTTVGGIVISMYLPIFKLVSVIK
ncbi:MAG: type II secretion system F family protein [Nitrospirae bacterium]|nr:type II secretion system F family protein [Nitrospirota bacterium]